MPAEWLTIPNLITFTRLGLVPVFVALVLFREPLWALGVFAVAMASDAVDGLLARLLHQHSKLGALLDPIADKLLVFAGVMTLTADGRLPSWLLGLIVLRDGAMTIGAVAVKRKRLEIPTQPTRIGKYATFASTCLVVLALASLIGESDVLDAYTVVVGFIAGLCVLVSAVQYFVRFGYLFFAPPRSAPSVDERKRSEAS